MKRTFSILLTLGSMGLAAMSIGVLVVVAAYVFVTPDLPSANTLKDVRLQVPLRVYTRDGRLMAEFGEKRRVPVEWQDLPERVVDALLAAEDDRFFAHPGVDYQGILRAAIGVIRTGSLGGSGGSTITMQVARNFFNLGEQHSRERTIIRKMREIFLSIKIEKELTKQEILTLYLNKIFMGQRAYGIGAAAEVYYGKTIDELLLHEIAALIGLLPAPSAYNPISYPERAKIRRAYVLRRMQELGHITNEEMVLARQAPVETYFHGPTVELYAPYFAEIARAAAVEMLGDAAFTEGYRVVTTADSRLQPAAVLGVRRALLEYERRHGYKGQVAQLSWPPAMDASRWHELLAEYAEPGHLRIALVVEVAGQEARAVLGDGAAVTLAWPGLEWAAPYVTENVKGDAPEESADVLQPGDVIYVEALADGSWSLAQVPEIQGAMIALDPVDGAVVALCGGFDFSFSKFNRALQARRQPGSAFKPFVYSAALENGFTAASVVNDAPVVFEDSALETTWRPDNYSGRFHGPTRLREALINSRNLVSIRVLRSMGILPAIDQLVQFGFDRETLPADLSLALGSVTLTPLQLANAYTVFANGGFAAENYFIDRVLDSVGETVFQADVALAPWPAAAHKIPMSSEEDDETQLDSVADTAAMLTAARVVPAENVFILTDMMKDVIRRGSGRRALVLGRTDLAGKTGTTNDERDAWFSGFNANIVATAWVGFDQVKPMGLGEQGGVTALPAWIDFMRTAVADTQNADLPAPPGLVTVRISRETGLLARAGNPDVMFETFRGDEIPELEPEVEANVFTLDDEGEEQEPESLF
ncbi:MAG: penicillin-binding protein 1A [Gammaproteobacteria bacterium]|nr:penicillin-binding protein 1A [Gammaproteobacteria bacterium]